VTEATTLTAEAPAAATTPGVEAAPADPDPTAPLPQALAEADGPAAPQPTEPGAPAATGATTLTAEAPAAATTPGAEAAPADPGPTAPLPQALAEADSPAAPEPAEPGGPAVTEAAALTAEAPAAATTPGVEAAPADPGPTAPLPQALAEAESPAAPEPVSEAGIAAPSAPAPLPPAPTQAPQAPAILLADSQGVRVLQPGPGSVPDVLQQVMLDTIAYDTEGEVVLTGRGRASSGVQLYLDNQPVRVAAIDASGNWRADLPQVDPGTYTLRVDEVDAQGAVTSRVETPFLREDPAVLEALPKGDGVSIITVQRGFTLWGIARSQYGRGILYVHVYEANSDQIRDPDLIYPGQIFTLPERADIPELQE